MLRSREKTRREHDLLGDRELPDLVRSLAMVKLAAARANHALGLLTVPVAGAIGKASAEILSGKLDAHFVVDMIQGGRGLRPT